MKKKLVTDNASNHCTNTNKPLVDPVTDFRKLCRGN